jgi:hypothetical protein
MNFLPFSYFDKAFVEREVVSYRILPSFLVLLIVGELSNNELVDAAKSQSLFFTFLKNA